jgi:hypothetical protein
MSTNPRPEAEREDNDERGCIRPERDPVPQGPNPVEWQLRHDQVARSRSGDENREHKDSLEPEPREGVERPTQELEDSAGEREGKPQEWPEEVSFHGVVG